MTSSNSAGFLLGFWFFRPAQSGTKDPNWTYHVTILKCHPEPFGVAQAKLREGSNVPGNMVPTPLAMV